MNLADLPEVRNLPVRDKLRLVDDLWLSIGPDVDSLEVSKEERQLLDARWESFLETPENSLSLKQFQEKMKALRG